MDDSDCGRFDFYLLELFPNLEQLSVESEAALDLGVGPRMPERGSVNIDLRRCPPLQFLTHLRISFVAAIPESTITVIIPGHLPLKSLMVLADNLNLRLESPPETGYRLEKVIVGRAGSAIFWYTEHFDGCCRVHRHGIGPCCGQQKWQKPLQKSVLLHRGGWGVPKELSGVGGGSDWMLLRSMLGMPKYPDIALSIFCAYSVSGRNCKCYSVLKEVQASQFDNVIQMPEIFIWEASSGIGQNPFRMMQYCTSAAARHH